MDNTNLQTPFFGQGLPTYPDLEQLCRVSASALIGTSPAVYPAFVEQFSPPLSLRDREPCYVMEPNRVVLGPGIYDTRLIGAFPTPGHSLFGAIPQLPLYATTCCLAGGFSSASAASASSGSGTTSNLIRVPIGTQTGTGAQVTLPSVFVATDTSLLVQIGLVTTLGRGFIESVTFNGVPLNRSVNAPSFVLGVTGTVYLYQLSNQTAETGDIVVNFNSGGGGGGGHLILMTAEYVANLPNDLYDGVAPGGNGTAGTPSTGTATTSVAIEFAQSAFLLLTPGGTPTWGNGFTAGQSVSGTVAGSSLTLVEGYNKLTVAGAVLSTLGSIAPAAWAGMLTTYY